MASEWDRIEGETERSFAAFNEYLRLPPGERSLARVTLLIGNSPKSQSQTEAWSRRFRWVERAAAYDAYMAKTAIQVRKVDLEAAQQRHLEVTTLGYTLALQTGLKLLNLLKEHLDNDEPVDSKAYNRVVRTIIDADTGMRRALKLPTQFRTETIDDTDAAGEVYIVGGD